MRASLIAAMLLTLSGCASPYGNYASLPEATNVQMADESAHELVLLYPPASTHLSISQTANDAYGMELVKQLREAGYAMQDAGSVAISGDDTAPLPVSYTVDHLGYELSRITVNVGSQSLSRVYNTANDTITAAGSWTRKE
jgi:hypothetical protein